MSFYMAVRGTVIVKLSITLRYKTTKPDYRVTYPKFLGLLEDQRKLPSKAKEKGCDFGWAADLCKYITRLRADHHHRISFFLTSFPTSSTSHHLQRCPSSERKTALPQMVSHRLLCSPVLEETRLVSCKTCQNTHLRCP